MTDQSICTITFPIESAGVVPVSNLVEILLKQSNSPLCVITGNHGSKVSNIDARVRVISVTHQSKQNIFSRGLSYAITQIRISLSMFKIVKNVDKWLFFIGGELLILPIIFAKLTRKPAILLFAGCLLDQSTLSQSKLQKMWMKSAIYFTSKLNRVLCNKLVVYSPKLISEWNLEPYRHKILIAHRHFLDFEAFTVTTPLASRNPLIGYIGRLSGEKGVQHFAQAIPTILNNWQELRVLIGGDGVLRESIEASLQEKGTTTCIDFPGWISHDDLPRYLNQLQLLVLPSYTEGLPNILLEAMACGTPVLATPVGAIPDIIIDGRTGYIMENNSPECIAANVNRALNSPEREQIAENGRQFVEKNFTFERVASHWKEVLERI